MKDGQEGFRNQIGRWMLEANDDIVRDAYELGLRQVAAYDSFVGRTEAKATGILSAVGLCVTLAATFGGWPMLERVSGNPLGRTLVIGFVVALGLGIVAAVLALLVLRVSRHYTIDELAVFNSRMQTETHARYRNAMAQHVWSVVKLTEAILERKTQYLAWAQLCFLGFTVGVFGFALCTAYLVLTSRP